MNHKQLELIKEIKSFIKTFIKENNTIHHDQEVINTDITWSSARFFANLITKTKSKNPVFTEVEFDKFLSDYESNGNTLPNIKSLFEKFWLRNVLGYIKIAGTIQDACGSFETIKELKNELIFLCSYYSELPKDNKKSVKIETFEKAILAYEKKNSITLDRERIYEPRWLNKRKNDVEFSNIDVYFKPFLDTWDEFIFINSLKKKYRKEEKGIKINKEDLERIHKSHTSYFPLTPDINTLAEQGLIQNDENYYYVNFYNSKVKYWTELKNKICGYYWENLVSEGSTISHNEAIKIFLENTFIGERPYNFLENTTDNAKSIFLDKAYKLLIEEQDVIGIDNEISKIRIDEKFPRRGIDLIVYYERNNKEYTLNNSDFFELYNSLNAWERSAQTTYLHNQNSREALSYLLGIIVKYDNEITSEEEGEEKKLKVYYFKRVQKLLKSSLNKPILLWDIICYIILFRKEIIPYLLVDVDFISLSFSIIDKLTFPEEQKHNLKLKLWKNCLNLALIEIRLEARESLPNAAKNIFQIYRQLNKKKFEIPYRRQSKNTEEEKLKEKRNREKQILTIIENSKLNDQRILDNEYLLPKLFDELTVHFSEFKPKKSYNNGVVHFPLVQWDGLFWLMRCSTYWKYKPQLNTINPNIHFLVNNFFKTYMDHIEIEEVEAYDYINQKKEVKLPTWNEKVESLEALNWLYPIYFLYKQQKLNSFLEPRFYFEKTEDLYDKKNRLILDKLRTHIAVLLQVFKKLILPSIPYGFEKKTLNVIKNKIEQQIIDYITTHIEDIPQEGKVDLFDYNVEWSYNISEKEVLLPQIARVLNWFSKKDEVIEAIVGTNDINKILTLLGMVTSVGIKNTLLEKIKKEDLRTFLEKINWIPEIQKTLLEISKYPELIDQTKKVISYWEENISKGKNEYQEILFKTKLLLTYFNEDEKELNSITIPEKSGAITVGEPNFIDYVNFYRALIKLKNEPEASHFIFDELSKRYPEFPVFALNRMAAKMNLANQKNSSSFYKEALEEWNSYAAENEKIIDYNDLGTTFFSNKMLIHFYLTEFEELDSTYNNLDLPDKMHPDILETKVNSLISRNKIEESLILLEHAKNYHKFASKQELAFIQNLKEKVTGIDNVDELKAFYNRIFDNSPEKLIKIFPERLNGRIDIKEFIVKELALAAYKMLDKINTIAKINDENKYNDLVQITLESRISSWGWTVKEQTHKGFSELDNDKENLGAIDIDILDYNKKPFITCEAFILRDIPRVQSHIKKLISRYTHDRDAFLLLIYFTGKQKKFNKKWEEYSSEIIPNIEFPEDYQMKHKLVSDLTTNYGFKNSAIKIGCSEHGESSKLYHVFVNVNYQITK